MRRGATAGPYLGEIPDHLVVSVGITGSVNDFNPTGFTTCRMLRINPDSAGYSITGFLAPASTGFVRQFLLCNIATNPAFSVALPDLSSSSAEGNRIATPAGHAFIDAEEAVFIIYDRISGCWRAVV